MQFAAGLLAPRRIDEMLISSGILALASVILFTWRSPRARQVVIGLLGVSIAVFFVLMLRAPQEVPRTLVLGLAASAVVVFMRR
ncbi:MAG: hypothetical protein RMA76_01415 [Deltaproteobacteria bacterium]